jgi:outer membrane biosynthesis protein TonB
MAKKKTTVKKKKAPAKKKAAKKPVKKTAPKKAKAAAKKPAAKKAKAKSKRAKAPAAPVLPWRDAKPGETFLGIVDDFFSHVNVITINLKAALAVGDTIHVRGHTTDNLQPVKSMQIERSPIDAAKTGDGVGILVGAKARRGDYVYKVQ